MGGTRPADRPASAGRWGREASTDHSHGDGEGAVDAVLFTVQDPRTTRHRRVPTSYGPARAPENCETRGLGPWQVEETELGDAASLRWRPVGVGVPPSKEQPRTRDRWR